MTVKFRDEALQDLEEIAGYIARDNPAAAFAVAARIHSVIYETYEGLEEGLKSDWEVIGNIYENPKLLSNF